MPQAGNKDGPKRVVFNSADVLFSEIRDQNFADIGAILSKRTKELSSVMNVGQLGAVSPTMICLGSQVLQ